MISPIDRDLIDRDLRAGRWSMAAARLDAAFTADPVDSADPALRRRRRMAAALTPDLERAAAEGRRVVALVPDDGSDWQHLAHIRLRRLDVEGAFAAACRALRLGRRRGEPPDRGLTRAWAVAFAATAFAPELTAPLIGELEELGSPPSPRDAAGMSDAGRTPIGVPWALPAYRPYSGAHPVIVSIFAAGTDVAPRWTPADAAFDPAAASDLPPRLAARAADLNTPGMRVALADFLVHRLPLYFHRHPPVAADFFHTVPFGLDGRPWVFHLEQLNVLHAPMVAFPAATIMPDAPWVALLRRHFRDPACRGILTHIRRTRDLLIRLFDDPVIAGKTTYLRLGFDVAPARVGGPAAPAVHRRRRMLLFTNSLNADNFLVRGGPDALEAFAVLRRRHPDAHLVVRSSVPADWPSVVAGRWRRHPGITWLAERMGEAEIDALYRDAAVFLLPSGVLHAISLVRALRCGAVPVVADAFGVDEFVRHGVNGLVVPGRRAFVTVDTPGALLAEDCRRLMASPFLPPDPRFQRRLRGTLARLLDDDGLMTRLSRGAARGAARDHDGRRWSRQASRLIRDAVGSGYT